MKYKNNRKWCIHVVRLPPKPHNQHFYYNPTPPPPPHTHTYTHTPHTLQPEWRLIDFAPLIGVYSIVFLYISFSVGTQVM